jgi:hypothetical protein
MVPRPTPIPFDDRLVDLCMIAYQELAVEFGGREGLEMACIQEFGNIFE